MSIKAMNLSHGRKKTEKKKPVGGTDGLKGLLVTKKELRKNKRQRKKKIDDRHHEDHVKSLPTKRLNDLDISETVCTVHQGINNSQMVKRKNLTQGKDKTHLGIKSKVNNNKTIFKVKVERDAKSILKLPRRFMFNPSSYRCTERSSKDRVLYKIKGERFLLYDYYVPRGILGEGAYGCVCEALNKKTGLTVAIKKNKGVFKDQEDAKRILREIKLLIHFDHDDIVGLINVIVPDKNKLETYQDVYLVITKMETTLEKVIESKWKLTERQYKLFLYQMLRGLKYIHSAGVLHRDIKPANILVNRKDWNLKITDFGLARGVHVEDTLNLTEYVVSRWYRAPEVMCSAKQYDGKVDVWSVGCIFAELFLRKPLFPGGNHLEQLRLIFSMLGTPEHGSLD